VPCIEKLHSSKVRRAARVTVLAAVVALAACSSDGSKAPLGTAVPQPTGNASAEPAGTPSITVAAASSRAKTPATVALPAPGLVRTWEQLRMQAAHRIVAANPDASYTSPAPEVLLAIPVLEIELNGDGSIRRIGVLRHPGQAKDTTQLAIDAVRRAAPFGDVSKLSKPWKFRETFLFNDDRQFKPRSLE
jgi:hypothetical protein